MTAEELVERPIDELFKQCTFQTRNLDRFGSAASDNCGKHATSGVIDPANHYTYWRCEVHRGQLRNGVAADVTEVTFAAPAYRPAPLIKAD